MATGLIYDDRFLDHDTGRGHPERPDRLRAIVAELRRSGLWERCRHLPFGPIDLQWVQRVHDEPYRQRLQRACLRDEHFIDEHDSTISRESYDVALLAAGGVVAAVEAVMTGACSNAFCAVRPPGHHAERDRSMGFCLLNNVAIAAEYLIARYGLERIAIVDFDVHHGNGTQHIFEHRRDVLFISLHEHPRYLYPGTGFAQERGRAAGEGFTLNLPIEPHGGDDAYLQRFDESVLPALRDFQPQFLLLSAGFDAAEHDPLASMRVTPAGFVSMTGKLKAVANEHCAGRIVSVLEGGYDLETLARCVREHVQVLLEA